MEKYGDFEEIKEEGQQEQVVEEIARARLPRQGELIGVIVQRYGGNRMDVKTTDGKSRNCRVPGKYKKHLWLRPGDFVLVVPWPDTDEKGDVIFKYPGAQISQLRKRGLLNGLQTGF